MSVQVNALTVLQPWASAIALGQKRIETRSWRAPQSAIGKTLLIHAGKSAEHLPRPGGGKTRAGNFGGVVACRMAGIREDYEFPLGAIVAVARLAGCWPITMRNGVGTLILNHHDREDVSERETALGDFSPGRFGWVLADLKALPTPIPWRGAQGLWHLPREALQQELLNRGLDPAQWLEVQS